MLGPRRLPSLLGDKSTFAVYRHCWVTCPPSPSTVTAEWYANSRRLSSMLGDMPTLTVYRHYWVICSPSPSAISAGEYAHPRRLPSEGQCCVANLVFHSHLSVEKETTFSHTLLYNYRELSCHSTEIIIFPALPRREPCTPGTWDRLSTTAPMRWTPGT